MALILNIETTTNVCSVALAEDGSIKYSRESAEDKSHASQLTVFIEEIISENNIEIKDLDAISVSKGPGSYTGLRIGVSAAKGLCYGGDVKLIAIDTLQAMALGMIQQSPNKMDKETILCPMIDARRMEVYSALYNIDGEMIRKVEAEIIDEKSFSLQLNKTKIFFFGDGSEKVQKVISHKNAVFYPEFTPSAKFMAHLSENKFNAGKFEDIAYFEPYYLKDFIATIPKKNIFR